jgi:DNA-binding XRE family transcriptional regulator
LKSYLVGYGISEPSHGFGDTRCIRRHKAGDANSWEFGKIPSQATARSNTICKYVVCKYVAGLPKGHVPIRGYDLMGRSPRPRPARLNKKLLQIRQSLGLSQSEMMKVLGLHEKLFASAVSGYEIGKREPPLPVLLKYARVAGVPMEVLADDDLDLPDQLPAKAGYEWIMKRMRSDKK